MDDSYNILETSVQIAGCDYEIKVFRRSNGKYFAQTRFSENDSIVSDGTSIEETLRVHANSLPLAISCRSMGVAGPRN